MSGAVEGVALLPCPNPWCEGDEGVEASQHIVSGKWHICCDDCMIESPWADSYDLAIAAWNTRTTPPARSYADGVDFRALLIEAGRNAGAYIDDRASDEFLKCIPEEVRLKIAALLSQGGKA